jgi:hypothetical protein
VETPRSVDPPDQALPALGGLAVELPHRAEVFHQLGAYVTVASGAEAAGGDHLVGGVRQVGEQGAGVDGAEAARDGGDRGGSEQSGRGAEPSWTSSWSRKPRPPSGSPETARSRRAAVPGRRLTHGSAG